MNKPEQQWSECPLGTLRKFAQRGPSGKLVILASPYLIGAVLGISISLGLFGWSYLANSSTPTDHNRVPVAFQCSDVMPLLASYHDQTLDAAKSRLVAEHLDKCRSCTAYYLEHFPANAVSTDMQHDRLALK